MLDIAFSPDDLKRLHQAQQILTHRLTNPPSLMELSRQVGLNDYKLKQGFRHIFGTTVFAYLRTCRMERAQQLLAARELSIAEVAHTVGYTSQSRFCDAFKKQFGTTPKAYQISLWNSFTVNKSLSESKK